MQKRLHEEFLTAQNVNMNMIEWIVVLVIKKTILGCERMIAFSA
ncbi:hypothetical protein [Cytobacillus oceanisediminis]|nr:hypothetical protein [Cytobacillus oceanisediminis]